MDAMSETTRVKNVVETVVADDHFAGVSKMVDTGAGTKMSKAVMKAYRRAKKVSMAENARARKIVSALRIKREGVAEKMDTTCDVTCDVTCDRTCDATRDPPSSGEQASIFDY
jgi:hypothetical protein